MPQPTPDQVRIDMVRLSFPHLYEMAPTMKGGDKMMYQATFVLPEGHPDLPRIKAAMKYVAEAKWGAGDALKKVMAEMPAKNWPIKECSSVDYKGYDDGHFIRSKTKFQPTVVDQQVKVVLDPKLVYAGCWVNALIGFYVFDNVGGKGIGVNLSHVQFVKDGERMDNRVSASDAFEPVAFDGEALADTGAAPATETPPGSGATSPAGDMFA